MVVHYVEQQHPRGPGGEWVKKAFSGIKGKVAPKSFKFYKQGYKPKPIDKLAGSNVRQYGRVLYNHKKAGQFANDYELWLAAQKLHQHAKTKHGANAPTPHHIVNAAFHHEIVETGKLNMLGSEASTPKPKNVHMTTPGGVQAVSKFLAPGQLEWTGKTLGGVSGARVYKDHKGVEWIVKVPGGWHGTSKAYSNSKFLSDLDVATSRIQNRAGLPVPAVHKTTVDGRIASVQKMYSRSKPAFPDNKPNLAHMEYAEVVEVQKNMVLDWLLSNHDAHTANFLQTDKGVVGIDKGQAFKYFGKDKLTPAFGSDLNPPLAPNAPVYSTLMKQHIDGKGNLLSFNEGELAKTIQRIQGIPDAEYKDMLRPYAEQAASVGLLAKFSDKPNNVNAFLQAAVDRKNNLTQDFASLQTQLDIGQLDSTKPAPVTSVAEPSPKLATGYHIVAHPTETGKFAIQKPGGDYSKNQGGDVKSWGTSVEVLNSSTMAKYKMQGEQKAKAEQSGAQQFAENAPSLYAGEPPPGMTAKDVMEYSNIKAKVSLGHEYTPDEYLKLKSYVGTIKSGAKAAGAAQVVEDLSGGFAQPVKVIKKAKGGFKEQPKFKKAGGAPPSMASAKGPNALGDGKALWEMKKAGKIADDFQMWSEAKKAANKAKKNALLVNPHAQAGVDYSSANQIRNVAMRAEYDETGDVNWETTAEKTSEVVGQTVAQLKQTVHLHEHKPTVPDHATYAHKAESPLKQFTGAYDSSKPVGSYQNPHAFELGDNKGINSYGYKYTKHSQWPPEQKSAWYSFSGSASGSVNTYFRTGDVGLYGNLEHTKKQCQNLVDAFKSDNIIPLDDWTQVVRGTSGGWEFGIGADTASFDEIKAMEGKVVRNKCPVSSSLRDRPPWGNIRITYKLPPGFRGLGLYGKSSHGGENEMILPPGMAYRILEVKKGSSYHTEVLVEVVDVKLPEFT